MHVPEVNLPAYRARKAIADKYDALGNALSNIRAYPEANLAWKQRSKWNARAQELRVSGHRAPHLDETPQLPPVLEFKLEGPYVPCKTRCGAPEPCFGCDSGDYANP